MEAPCIVYKDHVNEIAMRKVSVIFLFHFDDSIFLCNHYQKSIYTRSLCDALYVKRTGTLAVIDSNREKLQVMLYFMHILLSISK